MAGNATDTTTVLAEVLLGDGSKVIVTFEYDGVNQEPEVSARHIIDGEDQVCDVRANTEVLTDGIDLGYCAWCEEADSETYRLHEGHDEECPFA